MLRVQTLIDKLGEDYKPMLKEVKIAEFTKCIAQVSGLKVQDIPDAVIEDYLTKWATNKFHFFKLLGNKTRKDISFEYVDEYKDYRGQMIELKDRYPAYFPWLDGFSCMKNNKINIEQWHWRDEIREYVCQIVPNYQSVNGMSITSFFKRHLNAPDELVTEIGRIYENTAISATFTISIDPVDMMLASENPYGWNSCYRLESEGFSESHADGCMAAVLDKQSLITYVWNNEGKYTLYNNFELKSIRYYRMRAWIAVTPNFSTVHFNDIYPGKANYSEDFRQKYRDIVEKYISNYLKAENNWIKPENIWRSFEGRIFGYGYGEYDSDKVWSLKDREVENIEVYDERVLCPCGCGFYLPGTQCGECDDAEMVYNGDGMINENFEEKTWCSYCDDWCEYGGECSECYYYRRDNAVCELDTNENCENSWEAMDNGSFDPDYTRVVSCGDHCEGCPLYRLHHPEEFTEEDNKEEPREVIINEEEGTIEFPALPETTVAAQNLDILSIKPHEVLKGRQPVCYPLVYGKDTEGSNELTIWFSEPSS